MNKFDIDEFDGASEFDERTGAELYAEFLNRVERPKDGFVYYYSGYLGVMKHLTPAAKDLLYWMAINTDVNTGRLFVQSMAQRGALDEIGITIGTYYKALGQLKEHNLIKGENAVYFVNPSYVWKGTADARNKFVKVYPKL